MRLVEFVRVREFRKAFAKAVEMASEAKARGWRMGT